MVELTPQRLLGFARRIQHAADFGELLRIARQEVEDCLGYKHAWFMVSDRDQPDELKLIEVAGSVSQTAWEVAPVIRVTGDAFLEAVVASDVPIVIEDARTDPRTDKQMVELLQNRSIINVPLHLLDKPFGVFGMGTFGDEGVRPPTQAQVDYVIGMASQLAVAAGRIRLLETEARALRERRDLERRITQMQRLESLGMLAGGVAHDFNNLLTVMLSSLTLAQRSNHDAGVRLELDAALGAATRARDLTRQLLAMSRTQDLRLQPLDLNGRLSELCNMLKRIFPETIAIDLISGVNLPFIEADSSAIDQVFMNLCINARDAMPNGGRLVLETEQVLISGDFAATHPWARQGRYVLATVTDTGTGMPGDVMERVFEPFFTTKPQHAGTGLGLAVAHGIVSQHGGMLHCYSEVGTGTTFKVYLPSMVRMASKVGPKLQSLAPKGHEHVLLAEDDSAVRALACRILEAGGYRVQAVATADAACRLVEQTAYDLVVMDVVMPGMSSREAVLRLRHLRPELRILLSSGYSAGNQLLDLLRDEGLELLSKPYDPDTLLRTIRKALD